MPKFPVKREMAGWRVFFAICATFLTVSALFEFCYPGGQAWWTVMICARIIYFLAVVGLWIGAFYYTETET